MPNKPGAPKGNLNALKKCIDEELMRKKYFLKSPDRVRSLYVTAGIFIMVLGAGAFVFLSVGSVAMSVIAWVLTGIPVIALAGAMPAKTKAGAFAYMDILGFQEFMKRADKDRMERMGKKDLFYEYLPYAIALGVVDHWTRAFEGIYHDPPQWYVSPTGFTTFSPHAFSRSLNSVTSTLSSAMFSAPRGSGSGGGGFGGGGSSGGGFGGGGGGSW